MWSFIINCRRIGELIEHKNPKIVVVRPIQTHISLTKGSENILEYSNSFIS